ncbi:MAG: hypothetical protein E4H14_10360 [Candidatus Thorarchaeota archaeon]|nr:MAG: hypothetical protein E4H14_10360 [Candidatus Thorarchaeota archaeon]
MDSRKVFALVLIVAILGSSFFVYFYILAPNTVEESVFKGGTINQDETISSTIAITIPHCTLNYLGWNIPTGIVQNV